jgi:hypothetical protein
LDDKPADLREILPIVMDDLDRLPRLRAAHAAFGGTYEDWDRMIDEAVETSAASIGGRHDRTDVTDRVRRRIRAMAEEKGALVVEQYPVLLSDALEGRSRL